MGWHGSFVPDHGAKTRRPVFFFCVKSMFLRLPRQKRMNYTPKLANAWKKRSSEAFNTDTLPLLHETLACLRLVLGHVKA